MKNRIKLFIITVSFFFSYVCCFSLDLEEVEKNNDFNNQSQLLISFFDGTKTFSQSQIQNISLKLEQFNIKYNSSVLIYLFNFQKYEPEYNLVYFDAGNFAENLLEQVVPNFNSDSEVLLLFVDFGTRSYDICSYGDFTNYYFTDYAKRKIVDFVMPDLKESNYEELVDKFILASDKVFSASLENKPYDYSNPVDFENNIINWKQLNINIKYLKIALICGGILGLIVAIIVCVVLAKKMKTARISTNANLFLDDNSLNLTNSTDKYLYTKTVVHDIQDNNSNGTSVNSRGFSHSSGKF